MPGPCGNLEKLLCVNTCALSIIADLTKIFGIGNFKIALFHKGYLSLRKTTIVPFLPLLQLTSCFQLSLPFVSGYRTSTIVVSFKQTGLS